MTLLMRVRGRDGEKEWRENINLKPFQSAEGDLRQLQGKTRSGLLLARLLFVGIDETFIRTSQIPVGQGLRQLFYADIAE